MPGTLAQDGDPLDVILLVDGIMPQGTLVSSRLIGSLRATQDEDGDGKAETRNDRILAVPTLANSYGDVEDIGDLRPKLYEEIGAFFARYNELIGRSFQTGEPGSAQDAQRQLDEAIAAARDASGHDA